MLHTQESRGKAETWQKGEADGSKGTKQAKGKEFTEFRTDQIQNEGNPIT